MLSVVSRQYDDETPRTCPRCRRFVEAGERCEACEEERHEPRDPHEYNPIGSTCRCLHCRYGGEEAR